MAKDPTPHVDEKTLGNPEPAKAHWPLDLELHPESEEDKDASNKPEPKPAGKHRH